MEKGFGELVKAARSVKTVVQRETKRSGLSSPGGITKAIDDAGREVVRAATHVATRLGSGLEKLGKKAQEAVDPSNEHAVSAGGPSVEEEWPKTREEYERKYGRDGDDWPKSREEYEEKYGRPPRKRGDDDDPGFRIATGHD